MAGDRQKRRVVALSFIAVGLALAGLSALGFASRGLGLAAAAVFLGMVIVAGPRDRGPLFKLAISMVVQLGFWIGFAQTRAIGLALADATPGFDSGRAQLLMLVVLLVATLGVAGLGGLLARAGLEPSTAAKLGLAYVVLALGCTGLATAIEFARGGSLELELVIAGLVALALAAAIVGPASIAAVLELAPPRLRVAGLSSWFLSVVFAQSLGPIAAPTRSSDAMFDACLLIGFVAIAVAVLARASASRTREEAPEFSLESGL